MPTWVLSGLTARRFQARRLHRAALVGSESRVVILLGRVVTTRHGSSACVSRNVLVAYIPSWDTVASNFLTDNRTNTHQVQYDQGLVCYPELEWGSLHQKMSQVLGSRLDIRIHADDVGGHGNPSLDAPQT